MNGKSHTVNVDNFRDMLKICPKIPSHKFEEPPFKEGILHLIRDLGHIDLIVIQVKNKNSKKNNDMYYPRFTKVIVDYFMAKDQGIPRRNKMFWHYDRDDLMFTTIRVISKHHNTQTPKPKSTKNKVDSESSLKTKPTQASKGKRIKTSEGMKIALERSKIQTHSSYASGSGADEGTGITPGVPDVPTYEFDDEKNSWKGLRNADNDDDTENQDDNDQEQ
ncbi:hypothetical protein Tco_1145375 [Tanacetum coccineum]